MVFVAFLIVVIIRSNSARCGAVGVADESTTAPKHAKRLIGRVTEKIVKSGESGRLLKTEDAESIAIDSCC
jgi:hypothetical protein